MKGKSKKEEQAPEVCEVEEVPGDTPQPESTSAETPYVSESSEPEPAGPTVEQLMDRLLRLQADFDNYRKRILREKSEIVQRANEELGLELLPVLDHLELALDAATEHHADDAIVKGFQLVTEQLVTVLARFGITPLGAEGGEFDPNLHEAISHIPSVDVPADGIIVQVRKGYRLGDRLLRAAQVVVSSGCSGPGDGVCDNNATAEGGDSNPADS